MYSERMHNFRLESGRSFEPEHDAVIYHDGIIYLIILIEIIKSSKLNHPKTKSTIKNNLSVTPQIIIKQNNDSQQSATIQKLVREFLYFIDDQNLH